MNLNPILEDLIELFLFNIGTNMRKRFNINAFFIILIFLCIDNVMAQYGDTIKVLTYNLYAGGHSNNKPYSDIIPVLDDINADISGHQEVDSCNGRNSLDVINWLGEQTNRFSHFVPALKNWNGGQYGNGMLSKFEPNNIRKFWIDLESYGAENRSASEIEITMNGEKVRVLNTHVAYAGIQAPAKQAEEMIKWIDEGGGKDIPMIIMGDFNSTPGDAAMIHFEEAGFIYVKNENGSVMDNIDHIMYRPADRWDLIDRGKPTQYNASDHDPVWAKLHLKQPVANLVNTKLQCSPIQIDRCKNLKIKFSLSHSVSLSINLYTTSGKKIMNISAKKPFNKGNNIVDLTSYNLSKGIYILQFDILGKHFSKSITLF